VSIDNGKNTARTYGDVYVYGGGAVEIGQTESSNVIFGGNGVLTIEGSMKIGKGTLKSAVSARNAVLTGELNVAAGSTFTINDTLTIGNVPRLTTELVNGAVVSGKVTIGNTACILVYGQSGFSDSNIEKKAVSSKFTLHTGTVIFATEYKDASGNRVLLIPSTSGLRDKVITWPAGVTPDSKIQIGSAGHTNIEGQLDPKKYIIAFAEDSNIRWLFNGLILSDSLEQSIGYDAACRVNVVSVSGSDVPTLFMNGIQYKAGDTFYPTGNITFTTSNNVVEESDSKVPILLAILGIVIVILIILLYLTYVKNKKKGSGP
jgi:hypothetical protein